MISYFFYSYSSNHSDPEPQNDDGIVAEEESDNVKHDVTDNNNKRDVTNESDQQDDKKQRKKKKGDVKNESVGEKHDVITEEKEGAEKCDGKQRKKRKRDVTDNNNDNDGDVKNESVGEKRHVITEEKRDDKGAKKRKLDVTDKENCGDVTNESVGEKRDVKNESDVNEEEDEVIILKKNKITHVSLRRSARVQQRKNEMKGHLKKLADKRTKNLAGQFVFSESSVTFRPPEGYYGNFGVTEHNVKGGSTSVHDEDDDMQEVDSSSSTDKVIIKKPKKGFIDNELFPDDSLDVSYDTLKNNINKSISRLEADDIDVDHIMEDDGNRDVTAGADTDRDVTVGYSDRDVTVSDADVPKRDPMNLFARNRPDPVFTDDDDYRIERTPGVIDPKWRIRTNSYPIDNRGFGQHDAVLQQMTQGDERDKQLMQVLSHVVSQSTAASSVQNDEEEYVEEEDYEEESNGKSGQSYKVICGNGEETSEDKSNSNDDGDQNDSEEVSATSAYESANEKVSDKGHPQKRDETLQATKCDVTPEKHDVTHDADDGLKSQKHDGTTTLEAQKRDATTTLEPIVITPDQVVTDSIIDLSGQVLIDANTGNAYNINDVDVSQFTDVFIVNATSDNPLQNYQPVTLKLLDADDVLPIKKEQIDQPSVVL